jgi:hypothetical protein
MRNYLRVSGFFLNLVPKTQLAGGFSQRLAEFMKDITA